MKSKNVADDGLSGVYYAGTPLSGSKVYDLAGAIDPQGHGSRTYSPDQTVLNYSGDMPISKKGLTDDMVLKSWWYLSNGHYKAYPQIKKLTKSKKGTTAPEATILLERVNKYLKEQADKILEDGISDIVAYEKGERLYTALNDAKIKELKTETKELKSLLKDAAKMDLLKEELKARKAYNMLMSKIVSNNAKEKTAARDGFAYLFKTMPETHYGKLADLRANSL